MDQLAIVTGASEGIGRELARRLAREGYTVLAVARNAARLDELCQEIAKAGGRAEALALDLTSGQGVTTLVERLTATPAKLFVNNAGFGRYGLFHTEDYETYEAMLRLNIEALVHLSHAYLRGARRGDALINVSSTLAFLPLPLSSVYAATKAFVTSFSESLWAENRRRGIYVMNLCPGATKTEFHTRASAGGFAQRTPPAAMTETPAQVVDVTMRALARRAHPTVISGAPNKGGAFLSRLLGRQLTVRMMSLSAKA